MAWRPSEYLIEAVLDNSTNEKVTGWMKFAGMKEKVIFALEGNFHRDIRGAKIRLRGDGESADNVIAEKYMEGFSTLQKGNVGDITGGFEPADYVKGSVYVEWYGADNGRCVLELDQEQIELLTQSVPAIESDPISRKEQAENMGQFLNNLASEVGIPQTHAIATGNTVAVERAKKVIANDNIRGMKLLPKEIRETLPDLFAQDGKGGKTVAYVKFFTPSSSWTWYVVGGEPMLDESGKEMEFRFFGLVDGHEKELGDFLLSELEEVRGPMGLPIERDLHWRPKTLAEIAPEMFKGGDGS